MRSLPRRAEQRDPSLVRTKCCPRHATLLVMLAPLPTEPVGAYGLSISGLPGVGQYAAAVVPDAPVLEVRQERGRGEGAVSRLDADTAVIPLLGDGVLVVSRGAATALYRHPDEITPDELLHPWLVPAAATMSAWHGRRVLHGGLVSDGNAAVAVVGDKEGGKSTLLAHVALSTPLLVMSDDLVVLEDDTAYAGPRCIDLRPGAVEHLGLGGVDGALVRGGSRLRLHLPQAPATCELVGIVVLSWGESLSARPVGVGQRLAQVLPHALTEGIPLGREGVLGFTRYPVWELTRPRRWDSLHPSAALVQQLLASGVV